MKTCSILNCNTGSKYYAKGYCKLHYNRLRRHGDPLIIIKTGPRKYKEIITNAYGRASDHKHSGCKVESCNKKHFARGYCNAHYSKLRRYGDPLKVVRQKGGGWKQPESVKEKIRKNAKTGKNNPSWNGGVRSYRRKALSKYKKECCSCGIKEPIIVHHKDGNRKNNKIKNLEILCLNCHWKKHKDMKTGKETFSLSGY